MNDCYHSLFRSQKRIESGRGYSSISLLSLCGSQGTRVRPRGPGAAGRIRARHPPDGLLPSFHGPRARPVLSVIADRFRSIHMVLFDRKRNFSGPPLGGLAKNESKSDHFKWFDVCPDATHLVCPSSQYPVLKVHACAGSRFDRAARQGDILPDRRGPGGGNLVTHNSYTFIPAADACQSLPTTRRAYLYIEQPHG